MNPAKESSNNPTNKELLKENRSLREQLKKAQGEIERLRKALEEALRSLKRQAAPFSKGEPKPNPKPPGRKSGSDYGQRAFRAVPDRVDQQIAVPLPKACPDCGGRVIHDNTQPQFQEARNFIAPSKAWDWGIPCERMKPFERIQLVKVQCS